MTLSREEIEQLLPFLANGTLEGDELAQVEAAVADDPALAAELAALSSIRDTMQNQADDFSPGEMGLARLMKEVEAEDGRAAPAPRSNIWRIAAAVLLAVAVGQAALLATRENTGAGYELAGNVPAAFTIAVQPTTTEATLRAMLLDAGVEIVSGPSALGLYQLGLIEGTDRDAAQATLEAATDIIETLEFAQ